LSRAGFADEEASTRKTKIASDQSRDQLGLIESATTTSGRRGGSPGDDVERAVVSADGSCEFGRERARCRLATAELEIGHQLARGTLVDECGVVDRRR